MGLGHDDPIQEKLDLDMRDQWCEGMTGFRGDVVLTSWLGGGFESQWMVLSADPFGGIYVAQWIVSRGVLQPMMVQFPRSR